MRVRTIALVAAAALVSPAFVETPSIASATTARVWVTGYVDRGYTASGVYTHPGTCAVDPRVIPLGTYITIDGLGTCHAEDTGSAVIGYHVDLWVPTVAEAYAITGWRMATWDTGGSQQVLGYHAVAATATATATAVPLPTSTALPAARATPTIAVPPTSPPATAMPMSPTPRAAPAARLARTPLSRTRARRAHRARTSRAYATPTALAYGGAYTYATPTAYGTPVTATYSATAPATPTATYSYSATTPTAYGTPTTTTSVAPTALPARPRPAQPGRCHTIYWTTYVRGYRYTYWRVVCG